MNQKSENTSLSTPTRIKRRLSGQTRDLRVLKPLNIVVIVLALIIWSAFYYQVSILDTGTTNFGAVDVEIHGKKHEDGSWDKTNINTTDSGDPLITGTAYVFRIYADDVPHGFGIRPLNSDTGFITDTGTTAISIGKSKDLQVTFDNPGTYIFLCTIFCSAEHGLMTGTITVT